MDVDSRCVKNAGGAHVYARQIKNLKGRFGADLGGHFAPKMALYVRACT